MERSNMFDTSEQQLLDEMIQRRSLEIPRPPWMQSHRWSAVRIAARKAIEQLPPASSRRKAGRPDVASSRAPRTCMLGKDRSVHEFNPATGTARCAEINGAAASHDYEETGAGAVNCQRCCGISGVI